MNDYRHVSHKLIRLVEDIGLILIAIATVVAIGFEVHHMFDVGTVALADLLLLFIYLEVLAMVSIYLESGQLPVRMPIYIAIVALARYLILDMKNMSWEVLISVAVATFVLAGTVLLLRYGHVKLPYDKPNSADRD